ncbi:MAG: hypothetical protein PWP23_1400 [Candidatus Sumerlaeota bacterium]|nr:hypothetical protein [Candidatus Sumerlaeota bacterium]
MSTSSVPPAREYIAQGSPTIVIDDAATTRLLDGMLDQLGELSRVLLIPPDFTRFHSGAGPITVALWNMLHARGAREVKVLPALGTHVPMTRVQLERMYPGIPAEAFVAHQWRTDLEMLGEVPGAFVREVSGGRVDYSIRCEINALAARGGWDRIFSIGQLVPHEVIGIANQNKNIFVGTGGKDVIDKSHFLGAVCNMETIMGRADTPVRAVLDYMSDNFAAHLPITYVMTVRGNDNGRLVTRGLFAGDGKESFRKGAALSQQVNLDLLDAPLQRVVVFLDPEEFHSTWIGDKALYRTRMALADGGELIIMAPGVNTFGEDKGIDALIRKYGYRGTEHTLAAVAANPEELGRNLSAAAHLIHGSSEGRFRVVWCPGGLTRAEVESVGYEYGAVEAMLNRYDPAVLTDGWNEQAGVFFIRNPALGLWALRTSFAQSA